MFEDYNRMAKNFMTPKVLKFQAKANRIIELSVGTGLNNEPIWGVTELLYVGSKLNTTKNGQMFYNPKQAREYYKQLLAQ